MQPSRTVLRDGFVLAFNNDKISTSPNVELLNLAESSATRPHHTHTDQESDPGERTCSRGRLAFVVLCQNPAKTATGPGVE